MEAFAVDLHARGFGDLKGRLKVGTREVDPTFHQRMKTMDKTLSLKTSETQATEKKNRWYHLGSGCNMGRRSPFSMDPKDEENNTDYALKERYDTPELFLVERMEKKTEVGNQEQRMRRQAETIKALKNNGPKQANKSRGGKTRQKFSIKQDAHQRTESFEAEKQQRLCNKRGRRFDTSGRSKVS